MACQSNSFARKRIETFPRISLGMFPTPLHRLERLSRHINRNVYIKRDDLSGLALGGNKVRKLEFLLADAVNKGCDTVITTGGAQSNHAVLTAACCNKLGLSPFLVLKRRGVYGMKGNLIINALQNANVRFADFDDYSRVYEKIDELAAELRLSGKNPYVIPVGGSVPLGCLGYVLCALEISLQMKETRPDHIVCCTGSGGMHAGIALGAKIFFEGTKVTGIGVSDDPFEETVFGLMKQTAALLNVPCDIKASDVRLHFCFGEGYAVPSKEGMAAVKLMASTEGILLDPVYTGKAFAGFLQLCENGEIKENENVLFVHSGGAGALFAVLEQYPDYI
ncbi:MAG: D-cysteine desulfhydrase [Firmicutes bacterium ADurb.Bin182]|nr:MAG: D-cysteine desulfhydrase [Firmicutes bacterium ADurb.Bin182]